MFTLRAAFIDLTSSERFSTSTAIKIKNIQFVNLSKDLPNSFSISIRSRIRRFSLNSKQTKKSKSENYHFILLLGGMS